ncbi:hypothetical protein ACSYDW_14540 [Paeniglutamicibacter sp. R2-26]|uniref:hypothetical protein n=1 Tax=Paeniglutamicibacter sp. R2-26 TaxID=3144417 RepID=UPI003EE75481
MGRQVQALERLVTISAETQANRFDALLTLQEQNGGPLTFQDAVGLMAKRDVVLSRSTWHKLRDPKYLIKNFNVLAAFADVFGVDGEYLINEDAVVPEAIASQLQTLAAVRTASVMKFAARRFGSAQFSTEDHRILQDILMKYMALVV